MREASDSHLDLHAELTRELGSRSEAEKILEFTIVFLIGLTGLCGNFLIILVIAKTSSLRTISNYYIASLSFQDFLLSLCTMIFIPVVTIQGRWTFGDEACQFYGFVSAMLATASIHSMALIAINRYFIMLKSNFHRKHFTKRRVLISIAVWWVLSCNFPLSYSLQRNRFDFHPGKALCIFNTSKLTAIDATIAGIFNIQLPYIVMSVCYISIYVKVRRHQARLKKRAESGVSRTTQLSANNIRITKILFSIVLAFTFCWIPFFVIDLLGIVYGQFFAPRPVYVFYSAMAGSSSAVSPILYGVLNKEMKKEITKLLKPFLRICRKRTSQVRTVATIAVQL